MWFLLGVSCLIDRDLYEERRATLLDRDGDGFNTIAEGGDDCDDTEASVHPDADEVPYDTVDQDCDGADQTDVDGDGYDSLAAGGDDCDDSAPATYPGAEETANDGIDEDCDGGDFPDADGDGDPPESVGGTDCDDSNNEVYGGAVERWDNGFTDNDCDGDPEPASTTFGTAMWFGASDGARAGQHVAPLGDINSDGADSFLVSAVYDASSHPYGGAVYVVAGEGGGPLSELIHLESGGENWYVGTGLDGGTDVDGDGLPDLLIGATGMGNGAGGAFVVSSSVLAGSTPLQLPDVARAMLTGPAPETYAGSQTVFLDDITGDGLSEIAVSAPFETVAGLEQAGRVYVFPADVEGVVSLTDADLTWDGTFTGAALGNGVQSAGDQDGDGLTDVVLTMQTGAAAWLVPGGGTSGNVDDISLFTLYNPEALVVSCVTVVGDIDGDGNRDLLVSGESATLYVDLLGSPARTLGEDAFSTLSDGAASISSAAADLGDRDGDGLAETAISIPSLASINSGWIGIVRGSDWTFRGTLDPASVALAAVSVRPEASIGYSARVVGDPSGDGQGGLAVGAPSDNEGGVGAGGVVVLSIPR